LLFLIFYWPKGKRYTFLTYHHPQKSYTAFPAFKYKNRNINEKELDMTYIGMFGLVAKVEVLTDECNGKWTVKILEIITQSSDNKKYKMEAVNVGDIVRLDYGFLFRSKKLAISYAEESKKLVSDNWSGNSLLGLPF